MNFLRRNKETGQFEEVEEVKINKKESKNYEYFYTLPITSSDQIKSYRRMELTLKNEENMKELQKLGGPVSIEPSVTAPQITAPVTPTPSIPASIPTTQQPPLTTPSIPASIPQSIPVVNNQGQQIGAKQESVENMPINPKTSQPYTQNEVFTVCNELEDLISTREEFENVVAIENEMNRIVFLVNEKSPRIPQQIGGLPIIQRFANEMPQSNIR